MADMDEGELDAARMVAVDQRSDAVNGLLASRDFTAAVTKALENPPIGTKTAAIKDKNFEVVMRALIATKESQVKAVVKSLGTEQLDVLMKYVYKGLGSETFEGGAANWRGKLFKWHAAAVKAAGIGSIVRAMSRKTV